MTYNVSNNVTPEINHRLSDEKQAMSQRERHSKTILEKTMSRPFREMHCHPDLMMDVQEPPWLWIDVQESLWLWIGVQESPWLWIDVHEFSWLWIGLQETPWLWIDVHESPWLWID